MRISTYLADDEPLARRTLRDMLAEIEWVECVGEGSDGREALREIDALRPQLVLLDVRMPVLDGIEVLRRARHVPAVVFTTAYDRYAVTAFELSAVDYLLKPFGRERLRLALERARSALGSAVRDPALMRLVGTQSVDRISRLFVRERGRILPLSIEDVVRLEARDDYVAVYVAGRRHLLHVTLADLEARLEPEQFVRVHRSHIVNWKFVRALARGPGARLELELHDGTRVLASRPRSKALRQLTHFSPAATTRWTLPR